MNKLSKTSVSGELFEKATTIEIDCYSAGQRLDNFLRRICKGVPRSHLYRILRCGEVRVNKGRVDAAYRLASGDAVRIPPLRIARRSIPSTAHQYGTAASINLAVLYEDDYLLALDKPAGVAVHGGSGVSHGVIERLRNARPQAKFLELAHRLDRETSGILLIAKKRSALIRLHAQIRAGQFDKRYIVCVHADWRKPRRIVTARLHKYLTPEGERRVRVQREGQPAHTVFTLIERFAGYALLEAELKTGRTHQIRVHLAHLDAPIVGDDKYGDFLLNRKLARAGAELGIKRMFLHAAKLRLLHPAHGAPLTLEARLPAECQCFIDQLRSRSPT